MSWRNHDPGRWQDERTRMADRYRDWRFVTRPDPDDRKRSTQCWEGPITPFPEGHTQIPAVVAALDKDIDVEVGQGGRLDPCPEFADLTLRSQLRGLNWSRFHVRFLLRAYDHEAGRGTPRVLSVDPPVNHHTYPGHPHLINGRFLCPLFPPNGDWLWERDTLAEYLDQCAIWLAKHLIWLQLHTWIGKQMPHEPEDLLRLLRPDDPCHCGRAGVTYAQCHMSIDRWFASQRRRFGRGWFPPGWPAPMAG